MDTREKIKVLTVTTTGFLRKEGISTVIYDYYKRLDSLKFELHVVVSGEYSSELIQQFVNIGVKIRCLPSRKKSALKYYEKFAKLCKKERYDVIYIHGSSSLMFLELWIAKHYDCKKRISHSHNTTCNHKLLDKIFRPAFYRGITQAVACGNDAGVWLYGNRNFIILNNGRDPEKYKFNSTIRNRIRKELGIDKDCLALGHVGSFNEQKNHEFLIKIFKELISIKQNSKLFLIGDGKGKNEIIQYVNSLGLQKNVVFTGNINNVEDYLQAMDVMALPSLYEGLPLVVIEWQMSGLPCILSDKITKECVFTDNVYYMSLTNSAHQWAKKIAMIQNNDREKDSKVAVDNASRSGFDINAEVIKLNTIFSSGEKNAVI